MLQLHRKKSGSPQIEDDTVHPLLSIGFRPFFLLASLAAMLLVPLWLALLLWGGATSYWPGTLLHSHEMLFGFTVAVVAGFLLTAGSNWTKRRIASGPLLLGLMSLWLAGRLAPLLPGLPATVVAAVDLSFLPALAICFGRVLLLTSNRRNYVFIALLTVLSGANLLFHLEAAGARGVMPGAGRDLALLVVALIILVVGGRVIPMFTRNATDQEVRQVPWLDRMAMASTLTAAVTEAVGTAIADSTTAGGSTTATSAPWLWIAAGVLHLVRMGTWGTLHARAPLLWILHFGWGATALSLVLRGVAQLGFLPVTVGVHLLTVGGIGGLTLGMMTRVSLGHSGRMLVAPPLMTFAFVALVLATAARVLPPALAPGLTDGSWLVSGALWVFAFGLLAWFGVPLWLTPRVDAPATRALTRKTAAPKEHGFWVMMALSLTAGGVAGGTAWAWVIALVLGGLSIAGAMLVGREIRKNGLLQSGASAALGLLVVPVAAGGSGGFGVALHLGLVLSVAYLCGGFYVRSILERARKRPARGALYLAAGVFLSASSAALLFALGLPLSGAAIAVTLVYGIGVLALAPTPRHLRALGLSISAAHLTTVALAVFQL